jgi:hypothetical protein
LPYLEQDALYNQFKRDEPWDSEHNKKLIEKIPKIYAPPPGVKADKGHTFIQCFAGPKAMRAGMSFEKSFRDGTSSTFLVVEAGEPVIWTKPDDIRYDPDKPLPKLGGHFNGDFFGVMSDGSVKFFRKGTKEEVIRALITPDGAEKVSLTKEHDP